MKLVCTNCGKEYESGKFCPECGTKLQEVTPELVCPSCGYKAKSGKFCPECGTKLTEQIVTPKATEKQEPVKPTFNEKDPRFAKYYDKKGFPRTIPQEERAVAIEELTPFANQGIAEAKMLLGGILMSDSKNKDAILKGAKLIKEAEKAGDKLAYYQMGILYFWGCDTLVEQNLDEAERRLLEAFQEYQDGETAGYLANLYAFIEEKCDYKKAFDYATIAAEDENNEGYNVLGSLYLNGSGVEKNVNLALENYKMAAAFGDETAMNQIGIIFEGNDDFDANPEQSFYWFNEAAKKGLDVGMYNLGWCYKNGFGVDTDVEKAAEWFKKSADLGYVNAMCELGEYYQETLVDFNKAKMWYFKAAELGNVEAQNKLGVLYYDIDNDYKEAIKWFKKAMKHNNSEAYRNYAICLWDGKGTIENKKKAMEMMQKAISLGHPDAENELNEMRQELANDKKAAKVESEPQKEPQSKNNINEKKKTEDAKIDNVRFSTDGRKTLYADIDCKINKERFKHKDEEWGDWYEPIVLNILYNGKNLFQHIYNPEDGDIHEQVAIKDFELKLNIDKINTISLTIEMLQQKDFNDNNIENNWQVVDTKSCNVNLYYEFHIFGKNVLEIRD